MKRIIALFMLPVVLAGLTCITSCKNKGGQEQKKVELDQVQTLEQEIETNVDSLPTSAEVIKMLYDLEVGYIFGICNPVENTKKYFDSKARALNMGIFGADLSYATLYNIQQAVLDYLSAIRSLSAELNMSQIYDETLYDRIKQNFDYKDKLVEILSEAFDKTYAYLSNNEQQPLALLVVGGAWVEGMYITTHVSEAAYQVAGISKNLLEQKKSFELYLEITKPYMNDPVVSDFVKKLDPIKIVYSGLTTSLTEKNIMDITKAIEEIRIQLI
jgi:hypothetical protein